MIVFSPPRCDFPYGISAAGKQTTIPRFSLPPWIARPASSLAALRSLQDNITAQPAPATRRKQPEPRSVTSTTDMSVSNELAFDSPRSPFAPTLGSIPEVFEYEPLDTTSHPPTPNENQEPEGCRPEPPTLVEPRVSMARTKGGIILSPRRTMTARASTRVAAVLRKVLEADRVRRRRVLRVYLKAIVFLKMLLKSHERYSALMATQGAYMRH